MAKLSRVAGTTSQTVDIFIQDSSSAVGAGLTGLAFGSSGLTWSYHRNTASSAVAVTAVTATLGTFTSAGFIVVDATKHPGLYQIGIPNAALASGADSVVLQLFGVTNMAPVLLEIELTAVNNQNGNNFGLAYLPQGPTQVKKNQAIAAFPFPMFNSATGTPQTGLTVSASRSIDGGAFAACANAPVEIANGFYSIALAAADTNGQCIAFRFYASGAQDTPYTLVTQP